MTFTKPISVLKPPSSLDQKPALSRLSKRELEEVYTASTHYPQQNHNAADAWSRSDRTSEDSSQRPASQKSSSAPPSDSSDITKKSGEQQAKNLLTGHDKKTSLVLKYFYNEKEEFVGDSNSDGDQSSDVLRHDLDHLPPVSSLTGGMAALLSHVKSLFQPYPPSASLDDDGSIVPTTTVTGNVSKVDLNALQVKEAPLQQQVVSQGGVLKIENLSSDTSLLVDRVALMAQGGARVNNDIEHDENEAQLDIDYQTSLHQSPIKSLVPSSTDSDMLITAKTFLASDEKIVSAVANNLLQSQSSLDDLNTAIKNNYADTPVNIIKKEDEGIFLSRLGVAAESVLPSLNKKGATDSVASASVAPASVAPASVAPALVTSQTGLNVLKFPVAFSPSLKKSLLDDDGVTSGLDLDLEEQIDGVGSHDQKGESGSVRNMEVRGNVSAAQDTGDDTDFNGTQQERAHEATHKMVEGEENNTTMARSVITRTEIAPVTGSLGSSGADLSESLAAALRVTHLLDELTAAVSRLRLDSSDGKEMTIQLRRDVLAETNIHIVSTTKQIEVSFFTSNAGSNLLLNTHLTTLQNHLNSLCPGQVVNVQTQLTSSGGSSQMGSEQERSHDDLANFDQGNRGNSNNDNDTL